MQILHAGFFLLIYFTGLVGKHLIIVVIKLDSCFHTSMYFLKKTSPFLDLCYISVIVPKSIHSYLTHNSSISYLGFLVQAYYFIVFTSAQLAHCYVLWLLCCNLPSFHHGARLILGKCHQMSVISWINCFSHATVHAGNMFWEAIWRSNKIHRFFCDIPHMLTLLSCESSFIEILTLTLISCLVPGCFVITVIYFQIFTTVIHIPSVENQVRRFLHLPPLVNCNVFPYHRSLFPWNQLPKLLSNQDLMFAMAYTVLPPFLNPIIYRLRNDEIKVAMWRQFGKI